MPKNHVPNEILFEIFKQLKHEKSYEGSLAQCDLTCRQWKQPAQAVLYSALKIDSTEALDAIMNTPNNLENYVQSIDYDMDLDKSVMIEIALLFKNVVNFDCFHCNVDFFECMLLLLYKVVFPVLQTLPAPAIYMIAQEKYIACLEIIKDRTTSIILTFDEGDYIQSLWLMLMYLKSSCYGNTLTLSRLKLISKHFVYIQIFVEDFLFDTPIIPDPGVETLNVVHMARLKHSFMLYVMKKISHLKKLVNDMEFEDYVQFYHYRPLTDNSVVVLFLKYLYSIQTATGIFLEICAEEAPQRLLSLFQLLGEKQLQNTTFVLDFNGYCFEDNAVVINFTRNDQNNRLHIMLDLNMDCRLQILRLMEKVGSFLYRLHLKSVMNVLGTTLNLISVHCPRLNCLIISDGGNPDLDYSLSNEAIVQNHTIKRLEIRYYQIIVNVLVYNQFPCLKELVLYGFNNWKIPGSYFPMVTPFVSIDYFRLRLDLYSEYASFNFKKVFIKLETMEQETRYYYLDLESPEYIVENYLYPHINSTEAAYQESINDDGYMTLFIKCKSISKFVPTFSPSYKRPGVPTYTSDSE